MARRPEGCTFLRDRRTGIIYVRFSHERRRHNLSTGSRDPVEARAIGSRLYAETLSGRRSEGLRPRRVDATDLRTLLAMWIAHVETEIAPETARDYELRAFTHVAPFFEELARFTAPSIGDYTRARLRRVKRSTVQKELTVVRRFLEWAFESGHLPDLPAVPRVPRTALGTAHPRGKRATVVLTEAEVRGVLRRLPLASPSARAKGFPVRDFFEVLWLTGLRVGTLERLSVPEHYEPGTPELRIADEIDKSRYGRTLDLPPRAAKILDTHAPVTGLIFGAHDFRVALKAAARAAGLSEERAAALSHHDLRHSRLTAWGAETTSLAGLAYQAGHRQLTTTSRYVHSPRDAARELATGRRRKR